MLNFSTRHLSSAAFVAFLLWGAAFRIFGAARIIPFSWDTAIFYDGAWRVFQGLQVHHDFFSPLGPLSFVIGAAGYFFAGPNAAAYQWGCVLFLLDLGALAWIGLKDAYRPPQRLVIAFVAFSYLISIRILGYPWDGIGLVGYYNQIANCLLILLLACLLKPESSRAQYLAGFLVGAALCLKISYGLVALGLSAAFGLAFYLRKNFKPSANQHFAWPFKFLSALALTSLLFFSFIGFHIFDMLQDLANVAKARSGEVDFFTHYAWRKLLMPYLPYFILYTGWVAFGYRHSRSKLVALALQTSSVLVAEILIGLSITQPPEGFLLGSFFLLRLIQFDTKPYYPSMPPFIARSVPQLNSRGVLSGLVATATALLGLTLTAANYAMPLRWTLGRPIANGAVATTVKSGQNLFELHRDQLSSKRLLMVDWPDFLSFQNKLPSAKAIPLFWHAGVTFNAATPSQDPRYAPTLIFKEVDFIWLPKHGAQPATLATFWQIYRTAIEQNYRLQFENDEWSVWQKVIN